MTQSRFNPNEHLMQIKNKGGASDYLPVQWRLVWFRQDCPEGTISTELVHLDMDKDTEEEVYVWNNEKRRSEKVIKTGKGVAVFKATITDGKGGIATGTKMEKAAAFPDYLEKAETGSIGRALAALGYGTQFAPELNEAHRIVDSPVERPESASNGTSEPATHTTHTAIDGTVPQATAQQISSIGKLCMYLGILDIPKDLTFEQARQEIQNLTLQYRRMKEKEKAS